MIRRFFAVLCLLLFSAVPLLADSPSRWIQVTTDHFTVLSDGSDREARNTAAQLERMHAVFARILPEAHDDAGSSVIVFALRDRKGFQALVPPEYLTKNALDLAGFFIPSKDRNYILLRLDSSGEHRFATVYHEYTHYMLRHLEVLPLWLGEGEAELFQNTDISEREAQLGQPSVNDILYLREQTLIPLPTLFAVDRNSPYYHEGGKGNIFYAESWALTHFLFMQDFGKPTSRLQTYLDLLHKGEDQLAAANHAFGDLTVLSSQLDRYIGNGEYRALRMPLQTHIDEKALVATPIPSAKADALRSDVLVRTGRNAEGDALAHAVLASSPNSAEAAESLGLLHLRSGDMEGAREWYGKAVALHSSSFVAFYYFGSLSLQEGSSVISVAADSLREALRLNPHFAPALASLATCDAMKRDHLDEAVDLMRRAIREEPGNIDYRISASEIRVARREFDIALQILQAALKLGQTPADHARVQNRIEELQRFQQQRADFEALRHTPALTAQARAGEGMQQPRTAAMQGPAAADGLGAGPLLDSNGQKDRIVAFHEPDHTLPQGPPAGQRHTISGTIRAATCFSPKGLRLRIEGSGRTLELYSNDMYAIEYTAGNFTPDKVLVPCLDFDGMKARVSFTPVVDTTEAGQIVSMELSR